MAVTSIWPIKGRVDKVINYARNPEKTHDKEKLSELHEIEGVVEYVFVKEPMSPASISTARKRRRRSSWRQSD